jgi:hypothetical protein
MPHPHAHTDPRFESMLGLELHDSLFQGVRTDRTLSPFPGGSTMLFYNQVSQQSVSPHITLRNCTFRDGVSGSLFGVLQVSKAGEREV